ncbi:MAG: hybrid sensor histidine kinase/response regulator [Ramlibacter sp.]|nr:hybrid sensor histidine kinase/response regulator [Ramlibacter sp.]
MTLSDAMTAAANTAPNTIAERTHAAQQSAFEDAFYPGETSLALMNLMTCAMVWWYAPSAQDRVLAWCLVDLSVVAFNTALFSLHARHLTDRARKDRYYYLVVCLHALSWALPPVLFLDPAKPLISMFLVTILAGFSAAGVLALASQVQLYLLLFPLPFLSLNLVLLWRGQDAFHSLMALAMTVLLAANLVFMRSIARIFKRSVRVGFENLDLVERLRQQTVTAQEANAAKTKFLAAASHDLRQPVHALNLFVEALGNTRLDDHQQTILGHARAASQASRDMLDTLLDFSRIEAGVMAPVARTTALAPLLRTLEDEFGPQADAKSLVYRSRDTDTQAHCDPALVSLILRNFVSNAIRYTQRGGVLVGVRRRQGQLRVQVWDTGIGIAREHWHEVFREFRQLANEERDRHKGLGLGLAIVKGLADAMGTPVSVVSRPGRGSVFTLSLPVATGREAPSAGAFDPVTTIPGVYSHALGSAPTRSLRDLDILVVDDDAAVRTGMQALLQGWGCAVRTADSGAQALALAQAQRPTVLITDYRLRDAETGGDVIAALRAACGQTLAAIVITGDTDPTRIREAAGHTAVLLHKPVSASALQEALAQAARTGL